MDVNSLGRSTSLVGGGNLQRFWSRLGRLSHVYLKDQLKGIPQDRGYFRSSIFDLINEEIEGVGTVSPGLLAGTVVAALRIHR
jgi:hypothetical protein